MGPSVAPGSSPALPVTLGSHSTFGTRCPGPRPVRGRRCPDMRRCRQGWGAAAPPPARGLRGTEPGREPFEMGTRALPLLCTLTPDAVNGHRERHFLRQLNKTVLYPRRCWAAQPCQEHSQPAPAAVKDTDLVPRGAAAGVEHPCSDGACCLHSQASSSSHCTYQGLGCFFFFFLAA